jgi:hypothetical protein
MLLPFLYLDQRHTFAPDKKALAFCWHVSFLASFSMSFNVSYLLSPHALDFVISSVHSVYVFTMTPVTHLELLVAEICYAALEYRKSPR